MDGPSTTNLSLIIPTYNEAANIVPLLEGLSSTLGPMVYEVIVVDDNSPDQTAKIASGYAETHPWVRVFRRIDQHGLSSAVLAGFEMAKGDVLGVMDADLSHDEKILPALLAQIREGADLA